MFRSLSAAAAALSALSLPAAAQAPEPWPPLQGGSYSGPAVPSSPDPLVRYVWGGAVNKSSLQIFNASGVSCFLAAGTPGDAFDGWQSLAGPAAAVRVAVRGAGGLVVDFGTELPAWLELDSPDLAPADAARLLQLGSGEYSAVDIIGATPKQAAPVAYCGGGGGGKSAASPCTYRLETNAQLYEGVRYGFITVSAAPTAPFTITGFRAVVQTKPVNYTGSLASGDTQLDRIYYTAAYTVRTNLEPDYIGAILEDRGDRISWAGDAHVAQATSMALFGNFWDIVQNLAVTGKSQNGIATYTLYWIESVLDYWSATGDDATLAAYKGQMRGALDGVAAKFNSTTSLVFVGWDDRLGSGFQTPDILESQWLYRFLALHAYSRLAGALAATGDAAGAAVLRGYAVDGWAWVRATLGSGPGWWSPLGIHAAGEAANTGDLPAGDLADILAARFNDSTSACSLSNFNQYWLLRATAALGAADRGVAMTKLCWGGELALGATTFWEISSPDWASFPPTGPLPDIVPNGENGFTSLCHPWSAGPAAWLAEHVTGVRHAGAARGAVGRVLVAPHLPPGSRTLHGAVPVGLPEQGAGSAGAVEVTVDGAGVTVTTPAGVAGTLVLSEALVRRLAAVADVARCTLAVSGGAPAVPRWLARLGDAPALAGADADALRAVYPTPPLLDEAAGAAAAARYSRLAVLALPAGARTHVRIACGAEGAGSAKAVAALPPPAPYPPPSWRATFLGADGLTRGNWIGTLGADGYALLGFDGGPDVRRLPSYVASLTPRFSFIAPGAWARGTADDRALQDPRAPANRSLGYYASALGGDPTYAIDIALADAPPAAGFILRIYSVDWDVRGRIQTLALLDGATLDPLAPIALVDDFAGGVWSSWLVNSSVRIRVSQARGDNCVVSAVLFDPAPPAGAPVAATAIAAALPYTCASDADCELLGTCTAAGVCACKPGFTGPSCGSLMLSPAASCADCLPLWPRRDESVPGAAGASAWGASVLFEPADGLWHAWVAVACGGDGVVGSGGGDSWIAHLTSRTSASEGFSLANAFSPQTTFGPHAMRMPGGGVALIFRVNVLLTAPLCGGNGSGTDPLPAGFALAASVPASSLVSGDPEKGTSIYIATAPTAAGPWNVTRINITGAGTLHKSNPSFPVWLRDGRIALAYRYNPAGGSLNALAVSTSGVAGPYECIANVTAGAAGDEDPTLWQDPADGSLHMLWHNRGFGYHGFAPEAGTLWSVSPTHSHAFTMNVSLDNGDMRAFNRRERPELRLDASGKPTMLYTAVQAADTTCFSLAQGVDSAAA